MKKIIIDSNRQKIEEFGGFFNSVNINEEKYVIGAFSKNGFSDLFDKSIYKVGGDYEIDAIIICDEYLFNKNENRKKNNEDKLVLNEDFKIRLLDKVKELNISCDLIYFDIHGGTKEYFLEHYKKDLQKALKAKQCSIRYESQGSSILHGKFKDDEFSMAKKEFYENFEVLLKDFPLPALDLSLQLLHLLLSDSPDDEVIIKLKEDVRDMLNNESEYTFNREYSESKADLIKLRDFLVNTDRYI